MTNVEAIEYAKSKKALLASYIYQDNCAAYGNYAMCHKELEFVNTILSALRPITREQVEKVWRGEWIDAYPGTSSCKCTKCGAVQEYESTFCCHCGAPMTDEAVEMVMERMEKLHEDNGCS